jgi:hypothetical protein
VKTPNNSPPIVIPTSIDCREKRIVLPSCYYVGRTKRRETATIPPVSTTPRGSGKTYRARGFCRNCAAVASND